MIRKIISLRLIPYATPSLSTIVIKFEEPDGNYYFLEENDTIKRLCAKFQIIKEAQGIYDYRHLINKKCKIAIKEGREFFMEYCD